MSFTVPTHPDAQDRAELGFLLHPPAGCVRCGALGEALPAGTDVKAALEEVLTHLGHAARVSMQHPRLCRACRS